MDGEGFILIGGRSSRMGKDKFTLSLKGKTFLEIAFENLQKVQLEKVSVVVNRSASATVADGLNIDTSPLTEAVLTVTDIYQNRGPLGGIHSALVHSKAEFTILLACDYPFISFELIEFLMNIAKIETRFEAFAPIQADGKIQSLCAIYKTEPCRNQLLGGNSTGLFCLPVLNSKILRSTPGAIAEIGLTRSTGWPGEPTTS